MKLHSLFLASALTLISVGAYAQSQVLQSGSVTKGHAGKWIALGTLQDAGPWSGGGPNVGITDLPIVGTGTPMCIYDAPTTNALGYHSLCFGSNYDGTRGILNFTSGGAANPLPFQFCINGTCYDFPGPGNGNVIGPNPSTLNEVASFNSITGLLIRQGPAQITDNRSAAISTQGTALTGFSDAGLSAMDIANHAFIVASGIQIYDGLRGVAHGVAGTSINLVNGVSGYVQNDMVPTGAFPVSAALFGTGISSSNNAITWGINTQLSDTTGTTVSAGTGRGLNNEFDFNVTSPNTTVNGLQIAGGSLAQPALANTFVCQNLDLPNHGTVAKWSNCFISVDGATNHFATIGAVAATGAGTNSQDITWTYRNAGNIAQTAAAAWAPTGLNIATTEAASLRVNLLGAGAYATGDGGGFDINNLIAMQGSGAVLAVGTDVGWTQVFIGPVGAATINLTSDTVNITQPTGTINLFGSVNAPNLSTVAAGTGKNFVCIDAVTKEVFEGTGASCN